MHTFIIRGANFKNKGSQSMLYSTVNELKRRFPDSEIVMLSTYDYNKLTSEEKAQYNFTIMPNVLGNFWPYGVGAVYRLARKFKSVLSHKKFDKEINKKTEELLHNKEAIAIDISGYALSSQFHHQSQSVHYCMGILTFKKYHIPVYILPQSIGPFEYSGINKIIMNLLLRKSLLYPKFVCARENNGFDNLKKLGIPQARLAYDTVVTSSDVDPHIIYRNQPVMKKIEIGGSKRLKVAIVPNENVFVRYPLEKLKQFYKHVVEHLSNNCDIYVIRHSAEDIESCKKIIEWVGADKATLIEDDMNYFEFEYLIKQFDFCLASRFHAIVHSYRNGIPCVVLGWAVKYNDLLKRFNQVQFLINDTDINDDLVVDGIIDDLIGNLDTQKNIINSAYKNIDDGIFDDLGKSIMSLRS